MDVLLRVIRRIVLHDPIDRRNIQPSGRHVCAEQDGLLLLAKLEEGGRSLLLLVLAMDVHHGDVDVVQQLRVELHRVARGEKDLIEGESV